MGKTCVDARGGVTLMVDLADEALCSRRGAAPKCMLTTSHYQPQYSSITAHTSQSSQNILRLLFFTGVANVYFTPILY